MIKRAKCYIPETNENVLIVNEQPFCKVGQVMYVDIDRKFAIIRFNDRKRVRFLPFKLETRQDFTKQWHFKTAYEAICELSDFVEKDLRNNG